MIEKVKIGLDYSESNQIRRDAETFGFVQEGGSINISAFMNRLISNLYRLRKERRGKVLAILRTKFSSKANDPELISSILDEAEGRIAMPLSILGKPNLSYPISFRPSKANQLLFEEITETELKQLSLSSFLRLMLQDYLRLPQADREIVVCLDTAASISEAMNQGRKLGFSVSGVYYSMRPYAFLENEERSFAYLFGDVSEKEGEVRIQSFHLHKIDERVYVTSYPYSFSSLEEKELQKALEQGGASFIDDDPIEAVIELDGHGTKMLWRTYYNRPRIIKQEKDGRLVTVSGSLWHLRDYFMRFGKHAFVISPIKLRDSLSKAYEQAYESYSKGSKKR